MNDMTSSMEGFDMVAVLDPSPPSTHKMDYHTIPRVQYNIVPYRFWVTPYSSGLQYHTSQPKPYHTIGFHITSKIFNTGWQGGTGNPRFLGIPLFSKQGWEDITSPLTPCELSIFLHIIIITMTQRCTIQTGVRLYNTRSKSMVSHNAG